MCGIVGVLGAGPAGRIESMVGSLKHRGPDGDGIWIDDSQRLALGHTRLAILELSDLGSQPMTSVSGRYVIVFNGEIYNHLELRAELETVYGVRFWRGRSDTETLLHAFECWGFERTLKKINGMFGLGLWDQLDRKLYLARDRVGEKPLYYGNSSGSFVFASEMRAIESDPRWSGEIDRGALALFMRYNCIPAPRSIYSNIYKLPPATYLTINEDGSISSGPRAYWSAFDLSGKGLNDLFSDPSHAVNQYEELLARSVSARMLSDVPIGVFLSGGIDSALVAAMMQLKSGAGVKTFTIGTNVSAIDEAPAASKIAKYLGAEHTEWYVQGSDALSIVPSIADVYDEPFADSSQIPTILVSHLAKKSGVSVVLSGDGGDELFSGYNRYVTGPPCWERISSVSSSLRKPLFKMISRLDVSCLINLLPMFGLGSTNPELSYKFEKLKQAAAASSETEFYDLLRAYWSEDVVLTCSLAQMQYPETPKQLSYASKMGLLDFMTYLPDEIMTKIDRASMSVGLEARAPFLDKDLIEFSFRVPDTMKVRNGRGKWLSRELLRRYLPREYIDAPKRGFSIPLADWLRGPLRDWSENLLEERRLHADQFFDVNLVRGAWKSLMSGSTHQATKIWCVLMFQSWLDSRKQRSDRVV